MRTRRILWAAGAASVALALGACGDVVVPGPVGQDPGQIPDKDVQDSKDEGGQTSQCEFGQDDQCDDQDSCTIDKCLVTGTCEHTAKDNVCKIDGECYDAGAAKSSTQCQVCDPAQNVADWTAVICDDDNPCTNDWCDPGTGCKSQSDDSLSCDDGQACSTDDHCEAGQCVASACGGCVDEDCAATAGPCETATCAEGECVKADVAEGTACTSDDPCVKNATCDASGSCLGTYDPTIDGCGCQTNAHCDDGLECTNDICDTGSGTCSHETVAGSCLIADTCYTDGAGDPANKCQVCDAGKAQDAWTDTSDQCDDGDPCTEDICDPSTGCTVSGNYLCCTTAADCANTPHTACESVDCTGGVCVATPDATTDGTACDDGNPCTTGDVCTNGVCGGADKVCEPTSVCFTSACDAETGDCVETQVAPGTSCDDDNQCTQQDLCNADGQCVGAELDCSPLQDQCSLAACDPATGQCDVQIQPDQTCDDGNPCTPDETCDGFGACVGNYDATIAGCGCLAPEDCDDGLDCTVDVCASDGSCSNLPSEGTCVIAGVCYADGDVKPDNACQSCNTGASQLAWSPITCQDDTPCTDDSCDPTAGCVFASNDAATCDDADPCTPDDHCANGVCVGTCECREDADCTATADQCTRMACVDYQCVQVPDTTLDGMGCDDGAFCTTGETCNGGLCGGGSATNCDDAGDGNCLQGVCDEAAGACVAQPKAASATCSDGDPCTTGDTCSGTDATCAGTPMVCEPSDPCHTASCEGGSCAQTVATGASCSDGDACTLNDACTADGVCVGTWDNANCGCSGDSDCTAQTNVCNTGKCNTTNHSCYADPNVGASCNDGNACTYGDACNSDGACQGTSHPCVAPLPCMTSTCDGEGGCTEKVLKESCAINDACYADGDPNSDNPCQRCDAAKSQTAWTNVADDTICDADGSGCTSGDSCQGGSCKAGSPVVCKDDGLTCTDVVCHNDGPSAFTCVAQANGDGCYIGGACYGPGADNPSNECEQCDTKTSKTTWTDKLNGASCSDGKYCTASDTCYKGACKPGPLVTCDDDKSCTSDSCHEKKLGGYYCTNSVNTNSCLISNSCYGSGKHNPDNDCQSCAPLLSQTSWTNFKDGYSCTTSSGASGTCSSGTCVPDGLTCKYCCADSPKACSLNAFCSTKPCLSASCFPDDCPIPVK